MRALLRAALLSCLLFLSQAVTAAVSLQVTSDRELPSSLPEGSRPRDLRWASGSEIYLSLGPKGAVRLPVAATAPQKGVMPPADKGGFFLSGPIAVATRDLIVASPFGGFAWISLQPGSGNTIHQKGLANIMDIDAREDSVAILGADSGPVRGLASDGAIAWTGTLSRGLKDMRPLMKGRSSPGGKDMARCAFLETGAIRFMPDGSLVVLPGTEPGVYRYDSKGKLIQTWDTAPLGIVDDCAIDDRRLDVLAADFAMRTEWLASRVTVDDILPLPEGPALLLRRVVKGVTTFEMVTLPFRGKSERIAVPVTVPTPRGHLRGDLRGDQLALLAYDAPLPKQKPGAPTRVVVLSIRR